MAITDPPLDNGSSCGGWTCVASASVDFTAANFLQAFEVYMKKPNAVNKQCCGAEILFDESFANSERKHVDIAAAVSNECARLTKPTAVPPTRVLNSFMQFFSSDEQATAVLGAVSASRVCVRRVLPKSFARRQPIYEALVVCEQSTHMPSTETEIHHQYLIFILPYPHESTGNDSHTRLSSCSHSTQLCVSYQPASAKLCAQMRLYVCRNHDDFINVDDVDGDADFEDCDGCGGHEKMTKPDVMVDGDRFSWLYEILWHFWIKVAAQRHSAEAEYVRNDLSTISKRATLRRKRAVDDADNHSVAETPVCFAPGGEDKTSLQLVDLATYQKTYEMLKVKHWRNLVDISFKYCKRTQNWTERTDPNKFVAEDLGIAAYLMCLWGYGVKDDGTSDNQPKNLSWVDVGCGNGLLVYILACEGFESTGIDLRRRPRIWHQFERQNIPTLHLIERSIEPTNAADVKYFSQFDWLVGNHSDELTVWIPTLAALNNKNCMVLPCCAFDFTCKYQKKPLPSSEARSSTQNNISSLYHSFLDYVEYVCQQLCFASVKPDYLRIPSTKRKCFVCMQAVPVDEEQNRTKQLEFLRKCGIVFSDENSEQTDADAGPTISDFKTKGIVKRDAVEPVRNCSQVDKALQARIVALVFNELLSATETPVHNSNSQWNTGGRLHIRVIADRLLASHHLSSLSSGENSVDGLPADTNMMKQLKAQCGGLLTLLKNHSFIFVIESGGFVRLRNYADDERECALNRRRQQQRRDRKVGGGKKPLNESGGRSVTVASTSSGEKSEKQDVALTKKVDKVCYFWLNHPDRCPVSAELCRYKHENPPTASCDGIIPMTVP